MIAPELLTKEFIKTMLLSDSNWLYRGIVAIFKKQTSEEQHSEATIEDNGIGFNGVDAYMLSSFAKQIIAGRTLSPKQLGIAKKKMPKYAGQLLKIARKEV